MKAADADRFLGSFRLVAPPAPSAAATRTVAFVDAVCGRIPAVPITFEMPADYVSRRVGSSAEAGCLWGETGDLDRVTADPTQGDFTSLRRGVFRARMSTNIVFSDRVGAFDQMDGTGEAGIRKSLDGAGARVSTWKKQTLGGLPALEIVADVSSSRVFMLYLGNTRYVSNTLLVNYYPPSRRSADDDRMWARFVAGIRSTSTSVR